MTKRREFIRNGVIGTTGIALGGMGLSAKSYASVRGANDRINVAIVGLRGRGRVHIRQFSALKESKNVVIKTLCDADELFFSERIKTVEDATGVTPSTEWDMRNILEDNDIQIVSFATPNHWHALGTIWALQAGKHVYVEKPVSHNISEGRKMLEAAGKYKRGVVTGHNRAGYIREAIQFLHRGGIGEVYLARGLCFKPRDSFGIAEDSFPPASLHYDLWLGPALWREYNEKKLHYNWHWFWDTGNGDIGNQGPHQFNVARLGLNKDEHPVSVYSTGGYYGIDPQECAQETPNTQSAVFEYADGKVLEFEVRGRFTNTEGEGIRIGNIFYGSEGYVEISHRSWRAYRKREKEPFAGTGIGTAGLLLDIPPSSGLGELVDNVRSGKKVDISNLREGHYSDSLPHLANISYRLGRKLNFIGEYEKFADDPEADMMLSRVYREPYVVPETV